MRGNDLDSFSCKKIVIRSMIRNFFRTVRVLQFYFRELNRSLPCQSENKHCTNR